MTCKDCLGSIIPMIETNLPLSHERTYQDFTSCYVFFDVHTWILDVALNMSLDVSATEMIWLQKELFPITTFTVILLSPFLVSSQDLISNKGYAPKRLLMMIMLCVFLCGSNLFRIVLSRTCKHGKNLILKLFLLIYPYSDSIITQKRGWKNRKRSTSPPTPLSHQITMKIRTVFPLNSLFFYHQIDVSALLQVANSPNTPYRH